MSEQMEWLYNPNIKPAKELSKHDQQMIQLGWDAHKAFRLDRPKKIASADCPVYLLSQGKKWSPYITPDQYPCEECPLDCNERKQKRLDRPDREKIARWLYHFQVGENVNWEDCPHQHCYFEKADQILALISDNHLICKAKLAVAKREERERIREGLRDAFDKLFKVPVPDFIPRDLLVRFYDEVIGQALKEPGGDNR